MAGKLALGIGRWSVPHPVNLSQSCLSILGAWWLASPRMRQPKELVKGGNVSFLTQSLKSQAIISLNSIRHTDQPHMMVERVTKRMEVRR